MIAHLLAGYSKQITSFNQLYSANIFVTDRDEERGHPTLGSGRVFYELRSRADPTTSQWTPHQWETHQGPGQLL